MRVNRHAGALFVLAFAAAVAAGCAADSPAQQDPAAAPTAQREAAATAAECLERAGWGARVDDDDSVNVEVPKGQEDRYEAAAAECWATVDTPTFDDVTLRDREAYYARFVELRQCLVDQGLDMPAAPTFQTWVDMKGGWSPYADLSPEVLQQKWSDLESACPQVIF